MALPRLPHRRIPWRIRCRIYFWRRRQPCSPRHSFTAAFKVIRSEATRLRPVGPGTLVGPSRDPRNLGATQWDPVTAPRVRRRVIKGVGGARAAGASRQPRQAAPPRERGAPARPGAEVPQIPGTNDLTSAPRSLRFFWDSYPDRSRSVP
jgi:hypothetical protein